MQTMRILCLIAGLLLPGIAGAADTVMSIRVGNHPGFGRIVFDLLGGPAPEVALAGRVLTIRMGPTTRWAAVPRPPRNVVGIKTEGNMARIEFASDVPPRRIKEQNKLIFDFLDSPVATSAAPIEARARDDVIPPSPDITLPPVVITDRESKPEGVLKAVDIKPSLIEPERPSLALIPRQNGGASSAIVLPFGADVGAAAFREGRLLYVVFDEARPIDLAPLRDSPLFAKAEIRLVPSGTVLTIPAEPDIGVVLSRGSIGWIVDVRPRLAADHTGMLSVEPNDGAILVATDTPGRVVTLFDAESGAPILVGTLRTSNAAMLTSRRSAEFRMPSTFLGLVVHPVADRVSMRAARKGFVLSAGANTTLALSGIESAAPPGAKPLPRQFDFPALPVEALLRRLQAAQAATATAAPQDRTVRRIELAQALLSLGLGVEAQSLLTVTVSDDPRAASHADVLDLQAISAVIAGRFDEATRLNASAVDGSDETLLWRGLLAASTGQPPRSAAPLLSATFPILLEYPAPLKNRFLPLAAETLARGAETIAARRLLEASRDSPGLDFARVVLSRSEAREDDPSVALHLLDKMINGPDRLARSRALGERIELKLSTHTISVSQAADALERTIFSWRGDELDKRRRLRLAVLREQAGQWQQALLQLREAANLWPEQAGEIKPLLSNVFRKVFEASKEKSIAAFDFLALAADNVDLLPEGEKGQDVARHVADQLEQIELPRRAAEVLERLVAAAPEGLGRAELGLRLATQRHQMGHEAGALDALNGSTTPNLPTDLQERRALAFARSMAAAGDPGSALATLADLTSPVSLELRVTIQESAGIWQGASDDLRRLVDRSVASQGPIDHSGALLVVRWASAAARAGDRGEIMSIRSAFVPRVAAPDFRAMLEILTAERVDGVSDFKRAAAEAKLASTIPAALRTAIR